MQRRTNKLNTLCPLSPPTPYPLVKRSPADLLGRVFFKGCLVDEIDISASTTRLPSQQCSLSNIHIRSTDMALKRIPLPTAQLLRTKLWFLFHVQRPSCQSLHHRSPGHLFLDAFSLWARWTLWKALYATTTETFSYHPR